MGILYYFDEEQEGNFGSSELNSLAFQNSEKFLLQKKKPVLKT